MKYFIPLLPFLFLLFSSCLPAPTPPVLPAPVPYDAGLRDGSVIFWCGGPTLQPIKRQTGSNVTHAAIILYRNNIPYVCEAVPPEVHCVTLTDYRELMTEAIEDSEEPMAWYIRQPREAFTVAQRTAMKTYMETQLGRPYSVLGWMLGREVKGVFCSELIADTLEKSGKIHSDGVHESPISLYNKLPYSESVRQ
jgi:hypothetical protein